MRSRLGALVAAGAALLWLAGLASGAGGSGSVHATVRPTVGSQKTRFVARFTAQRTGYVGSSLSAYRVVSSGASPHGCTSSDAASVPPTREGQRVRVTLVASGPTHAWCGGNYSGRVEETIRPVCGYRELCPQASDVQPVFIATMTVGTFSFRVR
jgi:hypothetical protein